MSFIEELKRRNVIRVGVAYAVASWLILQVVDVIIPILEIPNWVAKSVLLLLGVGFIPTLIISWVYEMTPDGLKRDSDLESNQSGSNQTGKRLDRITIVLVLAVAAFVVYDRLVPQVPLNSEPAVSAASQAKQVAIADPGHDEASAAQQQLAGDTRQSIAIIPFVNMSEDASNEYFSDGISEELLNVLVRIESLRVPSRTSSFTFKGSDKKLSEIGRELQVEHVLEGSVRKAGNRIRVTAQLIDVRTDAHLWSETYTRELDDIFAVQDEIAQAIVEALKLELSVGDEKNLTTHSTDNIEAYNLYLVGRHHWNQRSVDSLHAAIASFKQAVELDSAYDAAWAGLAETYSVLPEYEFGTGGKYVPLARAATARALTENPNSARALTTSCVIKAQYDFDWKGAVTDCLRALELESNSARAFMLYGEVLMPLGRIEEGLEQTRLGVRAEPLLMMANHVKGYFLLWTGNLDEAESAYARVQEINPTFRWLLQNRDMLYSMRGEYERARQMARQLAELENFDPAPDLARIDAMENPELKPRALELLEKRQDIVDGVWGKGMQYALLEEWDLAMESLKKAFETESPWRIHMSWVANYEPLHDNPRYQALLEKMKLSEYWNN